MDFQIAKQNLFLKAFGLAKIPMIFACGARLVELNHKIVRLHLPLNWFTKNHHGSMYFGALCVGADVAGAALATKLIRESGKNVTFIFKDFEAKFLKRPENDVEFICEDGVIVKDLVIKAIETRERQNASVKIRAVVPKLSADNVAEFVLTLSLKLK